LLSTIQARSQQGIDRVDTITVRLFDSDRQMLGLEQSVGFGGALLTLRLVMWTADTTTFTSDFMIPFVGVCNGPKYEPSDKGDVLVITATSSHNVARIDVPTWQVSPTCGNDFPINADERRLGATDMSNHCFGCGYDTDQAGTDPVGGGDARRGNTTTPNLVNAFGRTISDSSGNFIWCGKTRADCEERGMFNLDSASRSTKRFNGIEWAPIDREVSGKSYLEGKTIRFTQIGRNDSIFAERFPMLYGIEWVKPVIANILGEPNSTRCEFVVCQDFTGTGQIGDGRTDINGCGILQVVVNGVIVPSITNSPDKDLYYAAMVANGSRNGGINPVSLFDSQGDPYGSLTTGVVVIYRQLAESGSAPNMMVQCQGPLFKCPNTADAGDQASWPYLRSTNPAFVLMDILVWSNWQYAEFDLQSFINESSFCDALVGYTDLHNNSASHPRFKAQFVLEKARKASEVIAGVLRCCNGQLTKDPITAKYKFLIRKTLADQQPSPVAGSNYSTAVLSMHADGTSGSGYVAFLFDESVMLKDSPDAAPRLPFEIAPSAQTPNVLSFGFQDEDNSFANDTITVKDADAVARAGGPDGSQEVPESFNVIGISNFDQGFRIANTILAEKNRGNPGRDPRGTYVFGPFQVAGIRIAHLKSGDIVMLRWQAYGFRPLVQLQSPPGTSATGILCRVQEITFSTNFQKATVTLVWHEDIWYTDKYGQQGPPLYSNPRLGLPGRPAYPWQPFGAQPVSGDSIYKKTGYSSGSWWSFGLSQRYDPAADGSQIAQVVITGCPPVNAMSAVHPPLVGIQGSTSPTGGSIPGGITMYFAIAAVDSSGKQSALSAVFSVSVPAGTNTNTITSPTVYWQPGSVGYILYGGSDSNNLTALLPDPVHTPANITLGNLALETFGPPDVLANKLQFQAKRVIHGGVWGDAVAAVTLNTLTFNPPAPFTVNQWANYDIQLLALPQGVDTAVAIANFRVSANDAAGNLTVSPDPAAAGIVAGSVFVMLIRPDPSSTRTHVVEPNFINAYAPAGLDVNEGSNSLRIQYGKGESAEATIESNDATSYTLSGDGLPVAPDTTSRPIIIETQWTDEADTGPISNAAAAVSHAWPFDVTNFKRQTILIRVNVLDPQGNPSLAPFAPARMLFLWGAGGAAATVVDGYVILTIVSDHVTPDLSLGLNFKLILNQAAQVTVNNPIFTGGSIIPGSTMTLYVIEDSSGGRPTPAFDSDFGSDVAQEIDGAADTRSIFGLTFHDESLWHLDTFQTGLPVT
jgi:hypothetical protein